MTKTALISILLLFLSVFSIHAKELVLEKGDHLCLVGNELGERMQHHNFWETLLHQGFSDHQLTVRNLCFPGVCHSVLLRVQRVF